MRIAILTNDYPPESTGGAGVIAATHAAELKRRGHDVRVFFQRPRGVSFSVLRRLMFHLQDLGKDASLVRAITTWRPEVIMSHNLTGCGFSTPRHVQSGGARWVHILHDVQLFEPSGQIVAGERYAVVRGVWRWGWAHVRRIALGKPDVVISPTQWLLDMHQRFGFFLSGLTSIIPNPMPIVPVAEVSASSRSGILYVGRLDEDKGVDVLVAAWHMLGEQRPDLTVVGEGKLRSQLIAMHDPRLHVVGRELRDAVLKRMSCANVVVVPSRVWENQSTVILEALACGCKVLASDVGGNAETHGGAGWCVPPGDTEALSRMLVYVMNIGVDDPVRREQRERMLRAHASDVVMDELERMLQQALKSSRQGQTDIP